MSSLDKGWFDSVETVLDDYYEEKEAHKKDSERRAGENEIFRFSNFFK